MVVVCREMETLQKVMDEARFVAVAGEVLDVAFQPIVEAATGRLLAYEALMRHHDRAGFSTPLDFLDSAFAQGALLAVEKIITRKALDKFSALPDRGRVALFLNLDGRLIHGGEAVLDRLLAHLSHIGIAPSLVCFELSERFDNTLQPDFAGLLHRMRRAGFKVAIDDFGAGHGEMKLLCDYPVDYIKIDRHFISGIDRSPRRRHLVRNIVSTAHLLGVKAVAEGMETEAEFLACHELGLDFVQGWFVGRPDTDPAALKADFPHLRLAAVPAPRAASPDRDLILEKLEKPPGVFETDGIDIAFDLFRQNPGQTFFPVLGAGGEPRGIIKEEHLKEYVYQPFGRDLLKNRVYRRTVAHFTEPAPIVALDTDAERMMSVFANMDGSSCVILTENLRYSGVVTAASLVKVIHEKSLQAAQEQNPLTGLPGNRAIGGFIQQAGAEAGETRFFCYCDFDNFKPFNDLYGFQAGDHAIMLFSALMRRYFFAQGAFLGHVGGDDFFIGLKGWERAGILEILARLVEDFRSEAVALYSPEARAAGSIRGVDRAGNERDFPLIRCSVGVLELPAGVVSGDLSRIGSEIAVLKADAKKCGDGICLRSFAAGRAPASMGLLSKGG